MSGRPALMPRSKVEAACGGWGREGGREGPSGAGKDIIFVKGQEIHSRRNSAVRYQ